MQVDTLQKLGRLDRAEDVIGLMADIAARHGYTFVAIGAPHRNGDFNPYFYSNWTQTWIETYIAEDLLRHDPMPELAALNLMPIRWCDILAGRGGCILTPLQRRVLEVAGTHGHRDGVCIPIHGPGAYIALAVYGGIAPDTSDKVLFDLHLLTLHADARLSALAARRSVGTRAELLSPREIEALACILAGMTDASAARKLGIRERTARFHIDNARAKLGAKTRAQAVAAALVLGLLNL